MQRANKGHIVTVGSVMGFMGARKLTDYCASKFAVHGFHEALVMELDAYSGVRCSNQFSRVSCQRFHDQEILYFKCDSVDCR